MTTSYWLHKPGGPGSCIYITREQGSPVISLALGSPFVASYDSQGYGAGIVTHLHKGTASWLEFV
jgi:hypothetical protein